MKQRVIIIFVLLLVLTGSNGEDRIVEQNNVNLQEKILAEGIPARIVQGLCDIIKTEGQNAVFIAHVAPSDCIAVWSKNGELLEAGEKYEFFHEDEVVKLTIKNLTKDDTGIYELEVKNDDGSDSSSALLSVKLLKK